MKLLPKALRENLDSISELFNSHSKTERGNVAKSLIFSPVTGTLRSLTRTRRRPVPRLGRECSTTRAARGPPYGAAAQPRGAKGYGARPLCAAFVTTGSLRHSAQGGGVTLRATPNDLKPLSSCAVSGGGRKP